MGKIIALVVGESGTGKTIVCEKLGEKYGLRQVHSYTTRPRRPGETAGHIFIDESEMPDKAEMCAYTYYNGYHYFATSKQVDEADLYVIDPDGIDYFLKHYTGSRIPKVVRLTVPALTHMFRMIRRGDTDAQIMERVRLDTTAFANIKGDVVIENTDLDTCVDEVYNYLCEQEGELIDADV